MGIAHHCRTSGYDEYQKYLSETGNYAADPATVELQNDSILHHLFSVSMMYRIFCYPITSEFPVEILMRWGTGAISFYWLSL